MRIRYLVLYTRYRALRQIFLQARMLGSEERVYSFKETELIEQSDFSVPCEYKEFECADLENYVSYSNCLFYYSVY